MPCSTVRLCGISSRFQLLSPCIGQVTHALLTRPPLSHLLVRKRISASFDLHVLSTPPAFILSQDQTLILKVSSFRTRLACSFCSVQSFDCVLFELFSRIFQGYFTVQLSMFCCSCLLDSLFIISKSGLSVKNFFIYFSQFLSFRFSGTF